MNNNKYLEVIKEVLSDPSSLTPDKVKVLVDETVAMLVHLKEGLASQDPAERQKAIDASRDLKKGLEGQMVEICKMTGLDPDQIRAMGASMMENASSSFLKSFDESEEAMDDAKDRVKKPKLRIVG